MSSRHLARTVALQTLFEWDFNGQHSAVLPAIIERNLQEFASGIKDSTFTQTLVDGVVEHQSEIDATIVRYAPEWPLDQITTIDRNILRIGIFELKFNPDIPAKVAINEAIEVAKAFGGPASGKFVNGVLGAIYKDMVALGDVKDVDKKRQQETASAAETPAQPQQAQQGGASASEPLERNGAGTAQDNEASA